MNIETSAQSKQITCSRKILKGLLVLNLFAIFISCKSLVKADESQTIEVALLKQVVANRIKFEKDSFMVVGTGNSNMGITNIIKEFKKHSGNHKRLTTLRSLYGIENVFLKRDECRIALIDSISKKEEYDFLLRQANQNSKWGNLVRKALIETGNIAFNSGKFDKYISQPVFTKNKTLAMVFVSYNAHSSVVIMGIENNSWHLLATFANSIY